MQLLIVEEKDWLLGVWFILMTAHFAEFKFMAVIFKAELYEITRRTFSWKFVGSFSTVFESFIIDMFCLTS